METLITELTPFTPSIEFDAKTGVFSMKGKSVSENTAKFFQPVFEWLEKYSQHPSPHTKLTIQLDYFNTASAKVLMDLFKKLEKIEKSEVEIVWLYDDYDEDMQEAGEHYQSISKIKFNIQSFTK
jgi:hypothetical protein